MTEPTQSTVSDLRFGKRWRRGFLTGFVFAIMCVCVLVIVGVFHVGSITYGQ